MTVTATAAVTAVKGYEQAGWAYELSRTGWLPLRSPYRYSTAVEATEAGERCLPYWVNILDGSEPF